MKFLLLLLLFCHVSSSVKHSLKFFTTAPSGLQNIPEIVISALLDDIEAGYCDTDIKKVEVKLDWMKDYFDNNPQNLEFYTNQCSENLPNFFKAIVSDLMQRFNQSGGVHILQLISGCEWDEKTGEVIGFVQYGYDGEDFISLNLETQTWVTETPQADDTKLKWDTDKERLQYNVNLYTQLCPEWLKKGLDYGKSFLLRTVIPLVSLLKKTPSSPLSCHATGFYPDRAEMFWRKDGEELHEDVDQGEILPNHDGTFQMSVDLKLPSDKPEDWEKYECVFHLSGVEDDIVTKLDKAVIRTNRETPSNMSIPIIATVVCLALVLIAATGFMVYKKKKAPDSSSELSERLNPETSSTNTQNEG